ncbi:MAG: hypothetical protein ABIF87_12795 [Pseudomonadota bacterium]
MRGRIFSGQKCPICGGNFEHDERRRGLFCLDHPEQRGTGRFRVQFGRKTRRRFNNYIEAERFLDGLRWEVDQGTYDPRDYKADNPLGFSTLALNWLQIKQKDVKPKSYNNLKNYMSKAINTWGQMNVKAIGYGEIEDFLYSQPVSDKTRANMKSCLHDFWNWLRKRKVLQLHQMPEFPEISFELGWRRTIARETQQAIVEEVHSISLHINPKIWIGIKWLCTYISIRPGELIKIKEKDFDLGNGFIFIPHPKEKKPKVVPILEEDVELVASFPKSFPDLPFFRHVSGLSGVKAGQQFGPKYLYKWWKKACDNLGIKGVDLYGGTRHSTAIAMKQFATPEQIRKASMHSTNKAFERYFRFETEDVREIYRASQRGIPVGYQNKDIEKDNLLKFK